MSKYRQFFPSVIVVFTALIASQTSAQEKNANDAIQFAVIEGQADSIRSIIETINKLGDGKENLKRQITKSQQTTARALQGMILEYFVQRVGNPEESMMGQLKLLNDAVAAAAN